MFLGVFFFFKDPPIFPSARSQGLDQRGPQGFQRRSAGGTPLGDGAGQEVQGGRFMGFEAMVFFFCFIFIFIVLLLLLFLNISLLLLVLFLLVFW